jgi:hypothetical protein
VGKLTGPWLGNNTRFSTYYIIIYVMHICNKECHASRTAIIVGLLTWNVLSSHTKEAETKFIFDVPLIVSAKGSFCPRDVNDRMRGFTLILSPSGVTKIGANDQITTIFNPPYHFFHFNFPCISL